MSPRRGLELLAALSVRVVKVRAAEPPPPDTETETALERCFERGDVAELYFGDARADHRFDRFGQCVAALKLRAMGEGPLHPTVDTSATYRLFRLPSFRFPSVVRVAQRNGNWEIIGRLFRMDGWSFTPVAPLWERTRRLSDVEATRLEHLLRALSFWTMPVTVERQGLDGTTWVLEGAQDGRYHVIDRWSPEEPPLVDLGEYLTAISGIDDYRPKYSLRNEWKAARQHAATKLAADEEQRRCRRSIERSNELSTRLAASMAERGVTCPHCGNCSRDMRYVDKRPDGRSYFVCPSCSRSFHPE